MEEWEGADAPSEAVHAAFWGWGLPCTLLTQHFMPHRGSAAVPGPMLQQLTEYSPTDHALCRWDSCGPGGILDRVYGALRIPQRSWGGLKRLPEVHALLSAAVPC